MDFEKDAEHNCTMYLMDAIGNKLDNETLSFNTTEIIRKSKLIFVYLFINYIYKLF